MEAEQHIKEIRENLYKAVFERKDPSVIMKMIDELGEAYANLRNSILDTILNINTNKS